MDGTARPEHIRFCEAVRLAVTQPVIVSKENLSCESARYVFGWKEEFDNRLLDSCRDKCRVNDTVLQSLLSDVPRFKRPVSHIGLNTDDEPDMVMSCITPQEMMKIIKVYNNHNGENVKVSLNSMMGLCGNIAAKSFLQETISISFGCLDSRKFAEIGRDRLAVGIPRKLFRVLV